MPGYELPNAEFAEPDDSFGDAGDDFGSSFDNAPGDMADTAPAGDDIGPTVAVGEIWEPYRPDTSELLDDPAEVVRPNVVVTERSAWTEMVAEEPQPVRVLQLERGEDGIVRLVDASSEVREDVLALRGMHRELAHDMAADHAEPTTARDVAAFFAEQGLDTARTVCLSSDELAQFRDRLAKAGFVDPKLDRLGQDEEAPALYSAALDLVVVAKDAQDNEGALNFMLAHEGAHSTEKYGERTLACDRLPDGRLLYGPVRIGLFDRETQEGELWEEAYGDYKAAEFVRNGLGLPNGPWPTNTRLQVHGQSLPGTYVWPVPGGHYVHKSALGGHGLELLAQESPALPGALNEARTSMVGVRRVLENMDLVKPGLYAMLQKLPVTGEDAAQGVAVIRQAIADKEWQRRWGDLDRRGRR